MAMVPPTNQMTQMGGQASTGLAGIDPKSMIAMMLAEKLMKLNKPQEDYAASLQGPNPYAMAIQQRYGGGM